MVASRKIQQLFIMPCCNEIETLSRNVIAYWLISRRVWRYQRGNQNPYFEEGQTTQWSEEKVQKNKQRSTKTYTYN